MTPTPPVGRITPEGVPAMFTTFTVADLFRLPA